MDINYLNGDATNPTGNGNKIIVHICNDIGGWGKGFVMAISKRWKQPEHQYREWFKTKDNNFVSFFCRICCISFYVIYSHCLVCVMFGIIATN